MASQVVSYAYDGLGNKLVETQSSTGTSQSVSTYYLYDGRGHVVAKMTPLDSAGLSWLSPQVRYMTYDGNGNLTGESYTLTGNDNATVTVRTTNTYDGNNQQTSSVTWRAGMLSPDKVSSITYDGFGEVTASGDGIANNVVTTYDNAGHKLTSTDPKTGELHTYGYNLAGQQVSDTVPLAASVGGTAQTFYTLDLDGHIVSEQGPNTNASTGENAGILHATYDAWGNVLSSTDARGNITTYTYNERNNVVSETEASVSVAGASGTSAAATPVKTSSYDIAGNLTASTDENGNVTRNVYDALGQILQSTDGAGAVRYSAYDAWGNKLAQQDANGNITFSNLDAKGRTIQSGQFVLSADGSSRQAVWQQAYVLDQNGDRIVSYDGIGSAYLHRVLDPEPHQCELPGRRQWVAGRSGLAIRFMVV
jgi:YD repeat-containing protein